MTAPPVSPSTVRFSLTVSEPVQHLVGAALALFLLLTLIAVFVPLFPVMPGVGLDPSWILGVTEAAARHLGFGRQIVFSFGPYAAMFTRLYHPGDDALILGASLYLAVCYAAALLVAGRRIGWWWSPIVCLVLADMQHRPDSRFFSVPLVAALALVALTRFPPRRPWLVSVGIVLLFAPLGLVPLGKSSALILCGGTALVSALYLGLRREGRRALLCLATPAVSMIGFWLLAGQAIGDLPGYLASTVPLFGGFNDAMAVDGKILPPVVYVSAAAILLLSVAFGGRGSRRDRLFLTTVFAMYLFVSWKAAFVRADAHVLTAAGSILLAGGMLPLAMRHWTKFGVMALALGASLQISADFDPVTLDFVGHRVEETYQSARSGLVNRIADPDWAARGYAAAMATIRHEGGLPRLDGTTDFYSSDQAYLIASDTVWAPRPVFQSYSAYTSSLLELNRQHLLGPEAPDNIIFEIQPIDDRLPSMEDGASWPILLQDYRPVGFRDGYLFLRHTGEGSSAAAPIWGDAQEHRFGERVVLPEAPSPVYAAIDLEPTLLGRAAMVLYKSSRLDVTLELASGEQRRFRLVADMLKTGVLLSPLIGETREFALLYGRPSFLADKRVVAFTIAPAGGGRTRLWQKRYDIRLGTLPSAPPDVPPIDLATIYGFSRLLPPPGDFPATPGDACYATIDGIGGQSSTDATGILTVHGWALAKGAGYAVPDATFIRLTDAAGTDRLLETHPERRPDIGGWLKDPALDDAGFGMFADTAGLDGTYRLSLVTRAGGSWATCPGTEASVHFSAVPATR